jgi:hypothetical protein
VGLFDSKKKHFAYTAAVRVIEDEQLPDIRQKILLSSIMLGKSLNAAFTENMVSASYRKFERMYKYAQSGDYFYGLPNAYIYSNTDGLDIALATLEAEVGHTVELEYLHYRALNNFHMGWQYLHETLGYNPETNIVEGPTAYTGTNVYLDKMVAVHETEEGFAPSATSLGNLEGNSQGGYTPERQAHTAISNLGGLAYTEEARIGPAETESVEIHLIWIHPTTGELTRSFSVLDLSAYSTNREYYHAKYTYDDGGSPAIGYWLYDTATGSNPTLNALFDKPSFVSPGTYFPFAVFRSNSTDRAAPAYAETEEFLTTQKLLNYIDMDFEEVAANIHENPDIDDVQQAVLMMGVPMRSDNQVELAYLHAFFKRLSESLPQAAEFFKTDRIQQIDGRDSNVTGIYAMQFSDADFTMALSFDGLSRTLQTGTLAEEYTNELEIGEVYIDFDFIWGLLFFGYSTSEPEVLVQTDRIYRRQLRPGIYEEIRIANARILTDVDDALREPVAGEGENYLVLPLDYSLVESMSVFDKEELYFRSLHFVFNSHIVQKVKWYETSTFRTIVKFVATAITILSIGTTWELMVAAAAVDGIALTALVFLELILKEFLVSLGIEYVITEVAKITGVELMLILAIAAAAYGGYKALETGKLVMSSSAKNLLGASTAITAGANTQFQRDMDDVLKEFEDLIEAQEALDSKIDEITKELESTSHPELLEVARLQPMTVFGETPVGYFYRTVEAGNVGAASFDIVQNFVEISLRLPSLEDTLGVYS